MSGGADVAAGIPWVERYRPKTLDDVSHQSEVVATLQNAVTTGRLPHLLFYGPPGSGKVRVHLSTNVTVHVKIGLTVFISFYRHLLRLHFVVSCGTHLNYVVASWN